MLVHRRHRHQRRVRGGCCQTGPTWPARRGHVAQATVDQRATRYGRPRGPPGATSPLRARRRRSRGRRRVPALQLFEQHVQRCSPPSSTASTRSPRASGTLTGGVVVTAATLPRRTVNQNVEPRLRRCCRRRSPRPSAGSVPLQIASPRPRAAVLAGGRGVDLAERLEQAIDAGRPGCRCPCPPR